MIESNGKALEGRISTLRPVPKHFVCSFPGLAHGISRRDRLQLLRSAAASGHQNTRRKLDVIQGRGSWICSSESTQLSFGSWRERSTSASTLLALSTSTTRTHIASETSMLKIILRHHWLILTALP